MNNQMEKIGLLFTLIMIYSCVNQNQLPNQVEQLNNKGIDKALYNENFISPNNIALLLPMDSFREESIAIRDGYVASQFSEGGQFSIKIYNVDKLGSEQSYLKAEEEGAQFIVGPLLKNNIDNIYHLVDKIPTLALNFIQSDNKIENLYQFALAPEDESLEIAKLAIRNGEMNAIALIPDNEWGARVFTSFKKEYEILGGKVLEHHAYNTESSDYPEILDVLNIDSSNKRYQRLLANIRLPIQFYPRRRQDIDFIFIAANSDIGRQISPLLKYHFADDPLKIYSISSIYDVSIINNSDLEDIVFPDMPYIFSIKTNEDKLKLNIQEYWKNNSIKYIRLFAMGIDANRIVKRIYNNEYSLDGISGVTGNLYIDNAGKVHRNLIIAKFINGSPSLINIE